MSLDENRRNFSSERGRNLTEVAKDIVKSETFEQFELLYIDYDLLYLLDKHEKENKGHAWQGIEVTDGFHPRKILAYSFEKNPSSLSLIYLYE